MSLKVHRIDIEDIAGDRCELTLEDRPTADSGVIVMKAPNVWLDKATATFLGKALLHMAEGID